MTFSIYSNGPLYRLHVSDSHLWKKFICVGINHTWALMYLQKIPSEYLTYNIHFYQYGNLIFEFSPRIHLQRIIFMLHLIKQELWFWMLY